MIAGTVTAILLAAFLGGAFWLFFVRKSADFDRIARMALDDETTTEDRP